MWVLDPEKVYEYLREGGDVDVCLTSEEIESESILKGARLQSNTNHLATLLFHSIYQDLGLMFWVCGAKIRGLITPDLFLGMSAETYVEKLRKKWNRTIPEDYSVSLAEIYIG